MEILSFFKEYEILIYLGLGLLAAWQMRKFIVAWQELRAAAFGLEMESAQGRLNRAAGMLVFLLICGIVEFGLVTFLLPAYPEAEPLATPTLDLLATPTTTLPAPEVSPQVEATGAPEEAITAAGCIPEEVLITSPEDGTTIRGIVEVQGTVDVPDFGFYKFEITRAGTDDWLTIQAGEEIVQEDKLGTWDTSQLEPGNYNLQLVVVDNEGNPREACVVSVFVEAPAEE
ncbi:MAG: hypothetical protein MAG431_01464 [Chloroflexi bacterium]|nr:hypothetical protein [Chloroflexota bacterium]